MVSQKTNGIIVFTVGVIVIILTACLGWIAYPSIVTNVLNSEAVLKENETAYYDIWLEPTVAADVYFKFRIFNVTNAEAVFVTRTEKPKLVELGPYVFSEKRAKTVLETVDGLITYVEDITYFYEEEMSVGSLDDVVFSPDPIYFTIASLIADTELDADRKRTVSDLMHTGFEGFDVRPYMSHTVDELLFKGWDLYNYLRLYNRLALLVPGLEPIPDLRPDKYRFGYFSTKNGTNSGSFTIESGVNNVNELGRILKWNNEDKLDAWNNGVDGVGKDPYCNMINGTDGSIYPPRLNREDRVYLFVTDLCRSIYATFEREVEEKGIKANRFTIPTEVFDGTSPQNLCFCRTPTDISQCFGSGILDMRQCLAGVPLLMSTPHFLDGDQRYVYGVEGLNPVKEIHETHFDLEPLSSAPLSASKRIQINFDVRQYYVTALMGMRDYVFPLLWVDESAGIDDAGAEEVKPLLALVEGIEIGRWVVLGVGILLAVVGFGLLVSYKKKRSRRSGKVV